MSNYNSVNELVWVNGFSFIELKQNALEGKLHANSATFASQHEHFIEMSISIPVDHLPRKLATDMERQSLPLKPMITDWYVTS